ncbi:cupin domain-containing protein [Aliiroseovarius sp. F20344]|uniref:cupin domain-containing protein n=1 Tax=Aliiroseovarius sp. F20344 TaxID=2926414 RepID=UPI001FF3CDE7|nr:cupin domain-containing protein [Aliiroseovarius sp. F20344]MCK0143945.1 cupin domain-containing protein [Aliiroseovarius sp. F20344]
MCEANGTATGKILLENSRMRVTEWRFAKRGDNTGWHKHAFDYLVIPMFDGVLEIDQPDGTRVEAKLQNGVPYDRKAGVEHDVINGNDFECAFIEVELLEDAPSV